MTDRPPPYVPNMTIPPGGGAVPSVPPVMLIRDDTAARERQMKDFINKYEIKQYEVKDLGLLREMSMNFIVDNSGSMSNMMRPDPTNPSCAYASRWNELKKHMLVAAELAEVLGGSINLYFLNQIPPAKDLRSVAAVDAAFATAEPGGYTPTARVFNQVLFDNRGKRALIVIGTDGEPTDDNGNPDERGFEQAIRSRPVESVFVSIMTFTDDKRDLHILHQFKKHTAGVDVTDDYEEERLRCLKKHGLHLTEGDYLVKALLGPLKADYKRMDQSNCTCTIL